MALNRFRPLGLSSSSPRLVASSLSCRLCPPCSRPASFSTTPSSHYRNPDQPIDHPTYPRLPLPPPIHDTTVRITNLDPTLTLNQLSSSLRLHGYAFTSLSWSNPITPFKGSNTKFFTKPELDQEIEEQQRQQREQGGEGRYALVLTQSVHDANRLLASPYFNVTTDTSAWGRPLNPYFLSRPESRKAHTFFNQAALDAKTQPTEALRRARVEIDEEYRLLPKAIARELSALWKLGGEGRVVVEREERERVEREIKAWEERKEREKREEEAMSLGGIVWDRWVREKRANAETTEKATKEASQREMERKEELIRARAAVLLKKFRGEVVEPEEEVRIETPHGELLRELKAQADAIAKTKAKREFKRQASSSSSSSSSSFSSSVSSSSSSSASAAHGANVSGGDKSRRM